jgi:hypothetical protein
MVRMRTAIKAERLLHVDKAMSRGVYLAICVDINVVAAILLIPHTSTVAPARK